MSNDSDTPAQMEPERFATALVELQKRLANTGVGVTIVTDVNGTYGNAGLTYVTLRMSCKELPGVPLLTTHMKIISVRDSSLDEIREADQQYWKDK